LSGRGNGTGSVWKSQKIPGKAIETYGFVASSDVQGDSRLEKLGALHGNCLVKGNGCYSFGQVKSLLTRINHP